MEEKREPSVWYVATIAICLFAVVMTIGGMFGGPEAVVAVTGQ